jgi:hypothetical protein
LIIGGENIGRFALESIDEDWLVTNPAGPLLQADVWLKLKEYSR